jgi:hypothetical protein
MVPEVYQVFWAGMAAGEFINDAAIAAGSYRKQGARWLAAAAAGQLDWWVKERQEWLGRVRGPDGRQRWVKAADLRPRQ